MESKLVKEWTSKHLIPSKDFNFFTRRDNLVVGKLKNQEAQAEYICPFCKFYEKKYI